MFPTLELIYPKDFSRGGDVSPIFVERRLIGVFDPFQGGCPYAAPIGRCLYVGLAMAERDPTSLTQIP